LLVGAFGVFCERYLLRRVHALGHWHQLLLTLGLGYVMLEGVKLLWGTESHPLMVPTVLSGSVAIGAGAYPVYRLFMFASALVILCALTLLLYRTRLGMIVRAAVSNTEMVNALGYNVGNVFTGVFALGAYLAGVAGVIAAPMLSVYPGMAGDIGIDIFVVVVVGGLGSLRGAMIASLLLGVFQSFGILLLPDFAIFFSFLLMAIVLTWKPMGLYGDRAA
jgi:branched-chain amino acid transport system permease protein